MMAVLAAIGFSVEGISTVTTEGWKELDLAIDYRR
jgi:hypothetical protein